MTSPCEPRKLGHCPLTGKPLYEVLKTFREGPMAGHPILVGKVLPVTHVAFFVTVSGRWTSVTLHAEAVPTLHEHLAELHRVLCVTNLYEEEARYARSGVPRPAAEMERLIEEWRRYYNDPPIGVLRVRPVEVSDG